MLPLIGIVLGIVVGMFFMPFNISMKFSSYVAVGILAALDSIFGGFAAKLKGKFNLSIFLSGFFGNAILAALLAYLGDKLGIQLYFAAIFAFGNRLFLNFATIRRILLAKSIGRHNAEPKDEIKGVQP